jgi:hypothetical protein
MPKLPLAELLKFTKFLRVPNVFPKTGYSQPFSQWTLIKNRVLYGQKPNFSLGSNPVQNALEIKRMNQYIKVINYFDEGKKKAVEFARDVAVETSKDYLKQVIAALTSFLVYLATRENDSQVQLKLLEKEKEDLINAVKSKEAEKEDMEAALQEIEKQYVTWMDWWNDTTGKQKTEIKTEIAKLSSQLSRLEGDLKEKSNAIKELQGLIEELGKAKEVELMLD